MACFKATIQAFRLWNYTSGFGIIDSVAGLLRIYCENFVVVFFSKDDKYSKGAKHMDLKYFSVKEEMHKHKALID